MTNTTSISRVGLIALAAGLSTAAAQAGEKIRYEEMFRYGAAQILEHRAFTVVTIDGQKHRGRMLGLHTDHVELFRATGVVESWPSDHIARIEIRQAWRHFHYVEDGAMFPVGLAMFACGGPATKWPCAAIVMALLSPAWAYTAVTAPFFLAADAVCFFLPPKVFEIVH